ncbi:MAG: WD40 repeat domain-containing protein [Gammaproteobacteria bacterium]|nr:WD40 repeat domain-containing protein [Gammaproteobacteria bacterium]
MLKFFGFESKERKQARVVGINPDALFTTLAGHTDYVFALAALPNDQLASGSGDHTIKLWDARGVCVATLAGHTESVYALAALPNGQLASGSGDKTIKLWDARGRCVATLAGHTSNVLALAALPNGQLASGSRDNTIKLWDARGGCVATLAGHTSPVTALAALPNGQLASGSRDNTIKLWDVRGGCVATLAGHTSPVTALAALPNGQLASGSSDNTIKLWDARGGCVAILAGHTSPVTALAPLPNGQLASGSWDKTIKLWEVGCRPVLLPEKAEAAPRAVAQSVDQEKLIGARKVESELKLAVGIDQTLPMPSVKSEGPARSPLQAPSVMATSNTSEKTSQKEALLAPLQVSNTVVLALSEPELEALTKEQERFAKRLEVPLEVLEQQLATLQQRLALSNVTTSFSTKETAMLRARAIQDQHDEELLLERRTIRLQCELEAYYQAIQTHFSALMVASLGIQSGYINVSRSQAATVVGWICTAISSAFPGASIATSAISSGVTYLDAQYREAFLGKLRLFGTTVADTEVLGEQVARLLVRVHVHAKTKPSLPQADKDAQAMIMAIVSANPPMVRNETTAETLVKAIFGNKNVCIDPLPYHAIQSTLPSTPVKPPKPVRVVAASLVTPTEPITSMSTSSPNSPTIEALMRQLEEERRERQCLEEALSSHQERVAQQFQDTFSRTEVASRKVAVLQEDIKKLKADKNSRGEQMLMTPSDGRTDAMDASAKRIEQQWAYTAEHVGVVSQTTLVHREQLAAHEAEIAALKDTVERLVSTGGHFASRVSKPPPPPVAKASSTQLSESSLQHSK